MVRIQGVPLETVLLVGLAVLSILLLFHARWAGHRISVLRRENRELVQTVTTVLQNRASETHRNDFAFRELEKPATRERASDDTNPPHAVSARSQDAGSACNAMLALVELDEGSMPGRKGTDLYEEDVLQSLADAISADRLDISLQPIVSISEGRTVGFDTFASVEVHGRGLVHLRRLEPADTVDHVELDVSMFNAGVQTARQRLGAVSERMNLHVAVSVDFLSDPAALDDVCGILRVHPAIARSIVISLPSAANHRPDLLPAVRKLCDAGLVLALEHEPANVQDTVDLPPITFLKIDADSLPAMAARCQKDPSGSLAELWRDRRHRVIAGNVTSEAEARQLVDMGVDLMTGSLFSEPRRLQRTDAENGMRAVSG